MPLQYHKLVLHVDNYKKLYRSAIEELKLYSGR